MSIIFCKNVFFLITKGRLLESARRWQLKNEDILLEKGNVLLAKKRITIRDRECAKISTSDKQYYWKMI